MFKRVCSSQNNRLVVLVTGTSGKNERWSNSNSKPLYVFTCSPRLHVVGVDDGRVAAGEAERVLHEVAPLLVPGARLGPEREDGYALALEVRVEVEQVRHPCVI